MGKNSSYNFISSGSTNDNNDEYDDNDDDDETTYDNGNNADLSGSNEDNSTRQQDQSSRGVPLSVQKILLTDLITSGGLKATSLRELCDRRPSVYGERGSDKRRKIQNKVNYLKQPGNLEAVSKTLKLVVPSDLLLDDTNKRAAPKESTSRKRQKGNISEELALISVEPEPLCNMSSRRQRIMAADDDVQEFAPIRKYFILLTLFILQSLTIDFYRMRKC